jgi:hypothetical protein
MREGSFSTVRFRGPRGECRFTSLAPLALGVCGLLRRARQPGLTVEDLAVSLRIAKRAKPTLSAGVVQKLIGIGVVRHGGSARRYLLMEWPEISPL